jgi:hypothetical protein
VRPNLQHVGYLVDDLKAAAAHFARAYRIGPFIQLPHGSYDLLSFRGGECVWDHSLALAAWGATQIELQAVQRVEPAELAELIGGPARLSHVCYRVADLESEHQRLSHEGFDPFLEVATGPIRFTLFSDPQSSTYLEVHREGPALEHLMNLTQTAAAGWDGGEALVPMPD